jgi:cytochrome c oxidase cbb3-type subunit 2
MSTHRLVGVPYTDEMIAERPVRLRAAGDGLRDDAGVVERYPGAQQRDFDGNPE